MPSRGRVTLVVATLIYLLIAATLAVHQFVGVVGVVRALLRTVHRSVGGGFVGLVVDSVVPVVGGGVVAFAVGGVIETLLRHRRSRSSAGIRTVRPQAPRSLRWVRGVLPGDEGEDWLAEVVSCLAETANKNLRHRYIRSYRRALPRLIWTSWAEHLSGSRRRELL